MSRPKKDPVETALDAYLALGPVDRVCFRRDVERIEKRTAGPVTEAPRRVGRPRKAAGQQADGTLAVDKKEA